MPSAGNWRITAQKDFARVFAARQRFRGRHLLVHHCAHAAGARLGLALAKRLTKTAVRRNRLRRCLYERFRHRAHMLPARDYVVSLRHACSGTAALDRAVAEFEGFLTQQAERT